MLCKCQYIFEITDPSEIQLVEADDLDKVCEIAASEANVGRAFAKLGFSDYSRLYDARVVILDQDDRYIYYKPLTEYSPL